jgi:arylsulfatase A-like enzyme
VLIARGPSFHQRLVSELPSGNVDVAPTVLRLLGATTDTALDGRPLIEGLRSATDRPPEASSPRRYEAVSRVGAVSLVHCAVIESVGHTRYVASLSAERV